MVCLIGTVLLPTVNSPLDVLALMHAVTCGLLRGHCANTSNSPVVCGEGRRDANRADSGAAVPAPSLPLPVAGAIPGPRVTCVCHESHFLIWLDEYSIIPTIQPAPLASLVSLWLQCR